MGADRNSTSRTEQLNIDLDQRVERELQYLVDLHRQHGAPNAMESVEDLIAYVLSSVADGSRRPGSWERQMLVMMGLVADCPEHAEYRHDYGQPNRDE